MHPVRSAPSATPTITSPVVLVVLVWGLVWGAGASQLPMGAGASAVVEDRAASAARTLGADVVWRESWSRQHPGCVSLALWPQDEQPVAFLTLPADGSVARVDAEVLQPPGRVVGACR